MKTIKKPYRAFLVAFVAIVVAYGVLMFLRDTYRLFGLGCSMLLWFPLSKGTLIWYLFRFFRQHLQFFALPLLVYLPSRRYWNHQIIHILITASFVGLTLVSAYQWQINNALYLTDFRKWQWCAVFSWSLLMLINYIILHDRTHSAFYSVLFTVNIAFIMGILYELPDARLRMASLTLPYLVSYACFLTLLHS